jgi:hypothetical protein
MGGASNNSGGGGGPANSYSPPPKKKNPIVKFIQGGGIVGAVVRTVKRGIEKTKDRKINDSYLGNSDYQGDVSKKPTQAPTYEGGGSDNNPILSTNIEATKQVASSGIVTNNGIVAPTTAEVSQATATDATSTMMSDAEISVANKKKGRSTTILNRATGLGNSSLNTTKKTLGA